MLSTIFALLMEVARYDILGAGIGAGLVTLGAGFGIGN